MISAVPATGAFRSTASIPTPAQRALSVAKHCFASSYAAHSNKNCANTNQRSMLHAMGIRVSHVVYATKLRKQGKGCVMHEEFRARGKQRWVSSLLNTGSIDSGIVRPHVVSMDDDREERNYKKQKYAASSRP